MYKFKDFGITVVSNTFTGRKIKVTGVLNQPIIVHRCKLEASKKFEGDECLHMQVEHKEEMRVIFTGSKSLIEAIKQVPENAYPFTTVIEENDDRYEFT